jgi:hypothetical protein
MREQYSVTNYKSKTCEQLHWEGVVRSRRLFGQQANVHKPTYSLTRLIKLYTMDRLSASKQEFFLLGLSSFAAAWTKSNHSLAGLIFLFQFNFSSLMCQMILLL